MSKIKILILVVLATVSMASSGQLVNSLYYLDNIPQASKLNPARMPRCNFYINWINVNANMFTELGPQHVYNTNNIVDDTLRMPYYNEDMWQNFLNDLHDPVSFSTESEIGLGFGFKTKEGYFHFDLSERNVFNVGLDKDLLTLNNLGNEVTKDFSSMNLKATAFLQLGLGYALELNSNLNIGAKLKLLKGLAVTDVYFEEATLYTSVDYWRFTGDATANISAPLNFVLDEEGNIEEVESTLPENIDFSYVSDRLFTGSNLGAAIDLGVEYKLMPNLYLSASLIDLGKIWWNYDVSNIQGGGEIEFDGIDEEPLFYDSDEEINAYFENLADSLLGGMTSSVSTNNFNTGLAPKLYVGAEYLLNEQISFGVLSSTSFYKEQTMQSIMFSANANLNYFLTAGAHYGWNFGYANTGGFTLGLNLFPIQVFVAADYLPLSYKKFDMNEGYDLDLGFTKWDYTPIPINLNAISLQVGLNFTFGCKRGSDVPIYDAEFDEDIPGMRNLK